MPKSALLHTATKAQYTGKLSNRPFFLLFPARLHTATMGQCLLLLLSMTPFFSWSQQWLVHETWHLFERKRKERFPSQHKSDLPLLISSINQDFSLSEIHTWFNHWSRSSQKTMQARLFFILTKSLAWPFSNEPKRALGTKGPHKAETDLGQFKTGSAPSWPTRKEKHAPCWFCSLGPLFCQSPQTP